MYRCHSYTSEIGETVIEIDYDDTHEEQNSEVDSEQDQNNYYTSKQGGWILATFYRGFFLLKNSL